jgi:hypothetical protein
MSQIATSIASALLSPHADVLVCRAAPRIKS